ncbi:hypothetical protein WKW80_09740 [Variovorax humicola]|uniref:DUF4280 domain-containing protein n=1 Tax=Variovorax humicola TaxID=1769758 RepID=A0ABU8VYM0_9BURK
MPGFLLHLGAGVTCVHAGQAMPSAPFPRVMLSKQPVTTVSAAYTVAGCVFNVSGSPCPCISAQWVTQATRVMANKQPVLLADSQAVCAPNGTGVLITTTQVRVKGM